MVDGVAASVYNTALGGEAQMHAFMVLGRVLWRRAPWLLHAVHHARLAQPLSLAIGRLVAAVRPRCWSPCGFGAKQTPIQQVPHKALACIAWHAQMHLRSTLLLPGAQAPSSAVMAHPALRWAAVQLARFTA